MKKYLFGLIGVALLGANPLLGQTPTPFPGGSVGSPLAPLHRWPDPTAPPALQPRLPVFPNTM